MYVFVGASFPMHRDLIWSIVRPLYEYSNSRHAYTPGQPADSTYQRTAELTPLAVTRSTSWTANIRNFAQRFPLGTWGSLTWSKSTTRVKQLKVPSEGLRSLNFSVLKNSTTSAGIEPASLGSWGGNVTTEATHSVPLPNYKVAWIWSRWLVSIKCGVYECVELVTMVWSLTRNFIFCTTKYIRASC
jgi:hypothetical protein